MSGAARRSPGTHLPGTEEFRERVEAGGLFLHAAWVVRHIAAASVLGFFILGVLYGFYVLWTGSADEEAPREKAAVYTAAIIVCAIVIGLRSA